MSTVSSKSVGIATQKVRENRAARLASPLVFRRRGTRIVSFLSLEVLRYRELHRVAEIDRDREFRLRAARTGAKRQQIGDAGDDDGDGMDVDASDDASPPRSRASRAAFRSLRLGEKEPDRMKQKRSRAAGRDRAPSARAGGRPHASPSSPQANRACNTRRGRGAARGRSAIYIESSSRRSRLRRGGSGAHGP